jgi:hypothetical protein
MTLSDWLAEWTDLVSVAANLLLIGAGLFGVWLVFRSLTRAYADAQEGRNVTRHYLAAAIGGAITVLGVIIGVISNLVA